MTLIVPQIGELAAVALETPLVLGVSWFAAGWTMRRLGIATPAPALLMGAVAFGMLMAAEAALAVFAFGNTLPGFVSDLASPAGALGLAGQTVFGLIPAIRALVRTV